MVSAVFEPGEDGWREAVQTQIEHIEQRFAEAHAARAFLLHMLECPSDHPTRDCPTMVGILDDRVAGKSVQELAAEHGLELPARPRRKRRPREK